MIYGSICSGIEAATVAWEPLGWHPAFFAEIDPFASAVLAHRYPEVPNLGDFTRIDGWPAPVDLLVGGTPCQSFSVAGRRAGLDDPRGVLAFEFLRLAERLRPRWLVFENVPGLLSSGNGRDFGAWCGALADCGYGFAYRVLDAQYFGLAQRRKRVFVVGYLGDWRPPVAVLFEPESLSGNPPPRREEEQRVARGVEDGVGNGGFAGSIGANSGRNQIEQTYVSALTARSGKGADSDGGGVAYAITSNSHKTTDHAGKGGRGPINLIYQCQGSNVGEMGSLRRGNGNVTGGVPFLVHALRGEGHDASEDGTGRGTPIVPVLASGASGSNGAGVGEDGDPSFTLDTTGAQAIVFDTTPVTSPGNYSHPEPGAPCHPLPAEGHPPAIAFDWQASDGGSDKSFRGKSRKYIVRGSHAGACSSSRVDAVQRGMIVRRLTPRECERLQGFPDVRKSVIIRVCGERLESRVLAGDQSLRSPRFASNAGENESLPSVRNADDPSRLSLLDHEPLAALSVQVDFGQEVARLHSRGRLLSSVGIAEWRDWYLRPAPSEADFARLAVLTFSILDQITPDGRAASLQNRERFSLLPNGSIAVLLSGQGITERAGDVEQSTRRACDFIKSTTSEAGSSSLSFDSILLTLCSSVIRAIASSTPAAIPHESSYDCELTAISGWTLVPYQHGPAKDTPRYRALGNSMAVPCMRWIGERIQMVDEIVTAVRRAADGADLSEDEGGQR